MADLKQCPDTGLLWVEAGFDYRWSDLYIHNDETEEAHVVPVGDSGSHLLTEDCPCCPQMNHDGVWEHRSYDDREAFETKKRRPS